MTIILISGYRDFNDYKIFSQALDQIITKLPKVKLVFGDCRGTDTLAKQYAREHEITHIIYQADWKSYGKKADPIRNKKMIDYEKPDLGIFFISKKSKGTKQCLSYAQSKHLICYIISLDQDKKI